MQRGAPQVTGAVGWRREGIPYKTNLATLPTSSAPRATVALVFHSLLVTWDVHSPFSKDRVLLFSLLSATLGLARMA